MSKIGTVTLSLILTLLSALITYYNDKPILVAIIGGLFVFLFILLTISIIIGEEDNQSKSLINSNKKEKIIEKPSLLESDTGWDISKKFKKLFPSLIGFGWNKTWHGERVDYALNHKPQNNLEKLIYKQFYINLLNGEPATGFIRNIKPLLKELGYNICSNQAYEKKHWVGNGKFISARRLEMIYDVNNDIFYQTSNWIGILQTQSTFPYLQYKNLNENARPEHRAWNDVLLPIDDPWWDTHYPTNGWNCRCRVRLVAKYELDSGKLVLKNPPKEEYVKYKNKRTGEVIEVPIGVHPGFNVNFYKLYQKKAGI